MLEDPRAPSSRFRLASNPKRLSRQEGNHSNKEGPHGCGACSPSRPNGWRVSGERGGEADERVRCTRVLGDDHVTSFMIHE
jgi:hypothetical protein